MKVSLLVFALIILCSKLFSQDYKDYTPLTPEAAAFVKYGEIPVGYYSGVPNITIPIYNIQSKELSLPLSLSYHAGGNKVETIAPWTGMGWSLQSIPSVSRSVRGLPDETEYGIMSSSSSRNYMKNFDDSDNHLQLNIFLEDGMVDLEPDIYSYSIAGESGKFFYDVETQQFAISPKTDTKITMNNGGFKIIKGDGTQYDFLAINSDIVYEDNSSNYSSNWNITKITSASKKDVINFSYTATRVSNYNLTTKTKYIGVTLPFTNPYSISDVLTNKIKDITFNGNKIVFVKSSTKRLDLKDNYSLYNIKVLDSNSNIRKNIKLFYSYIVGANCSNVDTHDNKWMVLDSIAECSGSDLSNVYSFEYEKSIKPRNRLSYGQDYWGYYNGHDSNSDLIPSYRVNNLSVIGADRSVNINNSKFGILKRIKYPTGGYTDFEFEGNEAYSESIEKAASSYQSKHMLLPISGDGFPEEGEIKLSSNSFTINNSPDHTLNNNNSLGGATLYIRIENHENNMSPPSSSSSFYIKNTSTNMVSFVYDNTNVHLPNGTYILEASFDQSSPSTLDYTFSAEWKELNTNVNTLANRFVGGLRVRSIKSYDANNILTTKKYKYIANLNSEISSGDIIGPPPYMFVDSILYKSQNTNYFVTAARIRSRSNVTQVTHSGSYIGYQKVFEITNSSTESGYIEYNFSHKMDLVDTKSPYPPAYSNELERGHLLEKRIYSNDNGSYSLVNRTAKQYNNYPSPLVYGIKSDIAVTDENASGAYPKSQYRFKKYLAAGGYSNLKTEISVNYFGNDSVRTVTNYDYTPSHRYNTRKITTDGANNISTTTYKYPQDYSASASNMSDLIDNNILALPIEVRESYNNTNVTGKQIEYSNNGSVKKILKLESLSNIPFSSTNPYTFTDKNDIEYYTNGLVKKVKTVDNNTIYYIWGYNSNSPVLKVESSRSDFPVDNIQTVINSLNLSVTGNISSISSDINTITTRISSYLTDDDLFTIYTHIPLIGVSSITDPNGITVYYEYDDFGRLEYVKDNDGNILSKNKYHYKNQ